MVESFFDDSEEDELVLGTPEGDGDFESDKLPETGETSAGGWQGPVKGGLAEHASAEPPERRDRPMGLEKVVDEISHGTLQP